MKTTNFRLNLGITAFLVLLFLSGCASQNYQQQPTDSSQTNQNPSTNENTTTTTPSQTPVDVIVSDNTELGKIFTDGKGMTLYIFTKDTTGSSTCYGQCAVNWPPLLVKDLPKVSGSLIADKFSVVARVDGSRQVAYEGKPLYYWIKDTKPGDTTGQNVGGVWFVYKVADDDLSSGGEAATSTK